MPLSTNPESRASFTLSTDAGLPVKSRPAFLVKNMTVADVQKWTAVMEQAGNTDDQKDAGRLLWEAISIGVTGWKNVNGADGRPLPFDAKTVFSTLNSSELIELAWGYPNVVRPTPDDWRFFVSPVATSTGESAASAPAVT